jgi:signal transduction histidine kinase
VLAARRGIEVRRSGPRSAPALHDPAAVAGAVDVVVDNALTYSPERAVVVVDVRPATGEGEEGTVRIRVENPLPADSGDGAGIGIGRGGAGIGLTIASTLLHRHGGWLFRERLGTGRQAVTLVVPGQGTAGGGTAGHGLARR